MEPDELPPDDLPPPRDDYQPGPAPGDPVHLPAGTTPPPARVLNVTPEQYHKLPGLSPSLATTLISTCLEKARDKYEREVEIETVADVDDTTDDEPDEPDEPDAKVAAEKQKRLDRGAALHALILGKGEERIAVIPDVLLSGKNRSISSDKAKAWRDAAVTAGKLVIKEHAMRAFVRVIAAIRERLAIAGHMLDGVSELAIAWWEPTSLGPILCRTMIDHVRLFEPNCAPMGFEDVVAGLARPSMATVYEVKFPDDAHPDRSERTAESLGYHIAAAARIRALNALIPSLAARIEYRYLMCEPRRPYSFWAPTGTGSYLELGRRRWGSAVAMWARGLKTGDWTGYHDDIMRQQIDLLPWVKRNEGFTDDE
jgi:hypothetical protein